MVSSVSLKITGSCVAGLLLISELLPTNTFALIPDRFAENSSGDCGTAAGGEKSSSFVEIKLPCGGAGRRAGSGHAELQIAATRPMKIADQKKIAAMLGVIPT